MPKTPMVFQIEHTTEYRYSEKVQLDPHVIRLTPRPGPTQRVLSHEITITPEPRGRSPFVDAEGNVALSVWFEDRTDFLKVTNRCEVETLCTNPFDFLVFRANNVLPVGLDPLERIALACYLERRHASKNVDQFAKEVMAKADGFIGRFLHLLTHALYTDFEHTMRDTGDPFLPEIALTLRKGACRDLTVLFMDACRSVGIPARFVSGYQEGDQEMDDRHLHAWPEVYLPGAGWRGYDPTMGLAVADRHVPLACSYSSFGAAPVAGTFWSVDATTSLESVLQLSVS